MKTQEILLASALIAVVAGVGTALATSAFREAPARSEAERLAVESPAASRPTASADPRALDELRMENSALKARLGALEARLNELSSSRTPVESRSVEAAQVAGSRVVEGDELASQAIQVTPAFVDSVGQALDTIRAREDAEREARRKEIQAQRIEDRVAKLQQELGLTNRQSSDLRTALIQQDDKREALFTSMREGTGDPNTMRDSFRSMRDETYATIQGFLTPEQFAAFQKSEESDFGRRGFDFGPGGGRPDSGGFGGGPGGGRPDSGSGRRTR